MKSTIVNLFGGPGSGKSTVAAGIVYLLKKQGHEAVLIPEDYKAFALDGNHPSREEQFESFIRQIYQEQRYYNLAEFIVTDAPLELCAYYHSSLHNSDEAFNRVEHVRSLIDATIKNLWVNRSIPYRRDGRLHTFAQAVVVDHELREYLTERDISVIEVTSNPKPIVEKLLKWQRG